MRNMEALSLSVQKLWPRLSFLWTDEQTDRPTDKQGDSYNYTPQTSFAGGIIKRCITVVLEKAPT